MNIAPEVLSRVEAVGPFAEEVYYPIVAKFGIWEAEGIIDALAAAIIQGGAARVGSL